MDWETPEATEIALACEISGYANAELSAAILHQGREVRVSTTQ
jgi:hypothetical protein